MNLTEIDDSLLFGMASGSFIPNKRFKEIGLMREDFWIDYIDYEFSFRVRKQGYKILGVGGARLNHRLGITQQIKVLGKTFSYQVHPAFRRYTIYRNRFIAIKEYSMPFPDGTGLGKPLNSSVHPLRNEIPIYLAAEGPKNVTMTAEIADGWLPLYYSPYRQDVYSDQIKNAKDKFEISVGVTIDICDEVEKGLIPIKNTLALDLTRFIA